MWGEEDGAMLANEDNVPHCMYTIVYGLKELGQCLPSIERAKEIKQPVDNRAVKDIGNCLRH